MTDELKPCPDCAVAPGRYHEEGCDVAVCTECGDQRLACDHAYPNSGAGWGMWTGLWPGTEECREYGWYAHFVPDAKPPWRRCGPNQPGAQEDLNRLARSAGREVEWDRKRQRWVRV